jgi:hypothetical protein
LQRDGGAKRFPLRQRTTDERGVIGRGSWKENAGTIGVIVPAGAPIVPAFVPIAAAGAPIVPGIVPIAAAGAPIVPAGALIVPACAPIAAACAPSAAGVIRPLPGGRGREAGFSREGGRWGGGGGGARDFPGRALKGDTGRAEAQCACGSGPSARSRAGREERFFAPNLCVPRVNATFGDQT